MVNTTGGTVQDCFMCVCNVNSVIVGCRTYNREVTGLTCSKVAITTCMGDHLQTGNHLYNNTSVNSVFYLSG